MWPLRGLDRLPASASVQIMQLLTKGNRQRTQEPTATNKTSSRSHAVLQVTVRQRSRGTDLAEEVHVGRLFMVDLAGSERASQVPVLFLSLPRPGSVSPVVREQDPVLPRPAGSPAPSLAPGPGEAPAKRVLVADFSAGAGGQAVPQRLGRAAHVTGSPGHWRCPHLPRGDFGAPAGRQETDV